MKKRTLILAALAVPILAPQAALAQRAGRIIEIKHVIQDSTTRVADAQHVWVYAQGDQGERTSAAQDRALLSLDQLGLVLPWATRLGIDFTARVGPRVQTREGEAVVARAFRDSRGNKVFSAGPTESGDGALYSFDRATDGRTRVEVHRGSIVLREWPGDVGGTLCIYALSACLRTTGTSYGMEVDDVGRARLAVGEGEVEIDWKNASDSTHTAVVLARAVSVWTWTETDPPVEEDTDEALLFAIRDGIEQYGRDIWRGRDWKPYVFGGIAVGILVCLLWLCPDGEDVSGMVIVNP